MCMSVCVCENTYIVSTNVCIFSIFKEHYGRVAYLASSLFFLYVYLQFTVKNC